MSIMIKPDYDRLEDVFPSFDAGDGQRGLDDIPPEFARLVRIMSRSLDHVNRVHSIMVSGSPLTGKTFLIRSFAAALADLPSTFATRRIRTVSSAAKDQDIMAMARILGGHDAKDIVYTTDYRDAVMIMEASRSVSVILEIQSDQALGAPAMNNRGIMSSFDVVDLDGLEMTWGSFVHELQTVNRTQYEPKYRMRVDDRDVARFARAAWRAGVLDASDEDWKRKIPRRGDSISFPIGIAIDLLETVELRMTETGPGASMRRLVTDAADDTLALGSDYSDVNHIMGLDRLLTEGGEFEDDDEDVDNPDADSAPVIHPYSDITTLPARLHDHIVGQEGIVDSISDALAIDAAGLRTKPGPIASFVFQGPSGVGKTELARVLAEEVFASPVQLIRLDMSEYADESSLSKLIGSAPGLVQSEDGGRLTNAIKQNPQCVLLLDEAEKAYHTVWNTFLQVLDSGVLTDARGMTVDFSHVIVILTTNLGNNEALRPKAGFGSQGGDHESMASFFKEALRRYFLPEFIGRLDSVFMFDRLDHEELRRIVRMQLGRLRGAIHDGHRSLTITIDDDDAMIDWLLAQADSDRFGARGVQNAIRRRVALPVSRWIISHENDADARAVTVAYESDSNDIVMTVNGIKGA